MKLLFQTIAWAIFHPIYAFVWYVFGVPYSVIGSGRGIGRPNNDG